VLQIREREVRRGKDKIKNQKSPYEVEKKDIESGFK